MLRLTLIALLPTFLQQTVAVPSVNPIPLGSTTCDSWPAYILSRGSDMTRTLSFRVSSSDDGGVEDLYLQPYLSYDQGEQKQFSLDLKKSRAFARESYRCFNGQISLANGTALSFYRTGDGIAGGIGKGMLTIGDNPENGLKPEPYAHEINGTRVDGVFLGAMNQTTWGFRYKEGSCHGESTYEAGLLGLDDFELSWEFKGFIKVAEYW